MKRMKELEDEHRRQKKRYLVERLVSVIRKEALEGKWSSKFGDERWRRQCFLVAGSLFD
jgi:hypothetical protein